MEEIEKKYRENIDLHWFCGELLLRNAISDYDKQLKIAIVVLKEEGKFPATLIEKIAKGVCSDHRLTLELAEVGYKSCISNLEALKAQLNGYQSIYKHLDSV